MTTKRIFKKVRCDICRKLIALKESNQKETKNSLTLCMDCFKKNGFTNENSITEEVI